VKRLVLRNKGQEFVFKFSGALVGISAILQLYLNSPRSWLFRVNAVLVIILLVLFITRGFGATINSLALEDDTLVIRWYNRLRKSKIIVRDIAGINYEKKCIRIILKNDRVIRIPVNFLELKEQRHVRAFLKEATGL